MATLRAQAFANNVTTNLVGVIAGDLMVVCYRERDSSGAPTILSDLDGAFTVADGENTNGNAQILYLVATTTGTHAISQSAGGGVWDANLFCFAPDVGGNTWTLGNHDAAPVASATAHAAPSCIALAGVVCAAACHDGPSGGETEGADTFTAGTSSGDRRYHRYKLTTGATYTAPYTTGSAVPSAQVIAAFTETAGSPPASPRPRYIGI